MANGANKSALEKMWSCFLAEEQQLITFPKHRVDNFSAGNLTEETAELFLFPSLSSVSSNTLTDQFTLVKTLE